MAYVVAGMVGSSSRWHGRRSSDLLVEQSIEHPELANAAQSNMCREVAHLRSVCVRSSAGPGNMRCQDYYQSHDGYGRRTPCE